MWLRAMSPYNYRSPTPKLCIASIYLMALLAVQKRFDILRQEYATSGNFLHASLLRPLVDDVLSVSGNAWLRRLFCFVIRNCVALKALVMMNTQPQTSCAAIEGHAIRLFEEYHHNSPVLALSAFSYVPWATYITHVPGSESNRIYCSGDSRRATSPVKWSI